MSRSITTPIKSFRPQRTGNISPSAGHRGILKPRYDSSTSIDPINMLWAFLNVPDIDWFLYDEYYNIGKIDALDIHSVYTTEIDKVASNPRYSRHYETSNPCSVCVNNGKNFDKCGILKNHNFLKRHCIQSSICKKWLNQLQTDQSTASISQMNTKNETDVFDPYLLMYQE